MYIGVSGPDVSNSLKDVTGTFFDSLLYIFGRVGGGK